MLFNGITVSASKKGLVYDKTLLNSDVNNATLDADTVFCILHPKSDSMLYFIDLVELEVYICSNNYIPELVSNFTVTKQSDGTYRLNRNSSSTQRLITFKLK